MFKIQYYYCNTETEKIIGNINLIKEVKIATKANPWYNNDFTSIIMILQV
jgi:hypothetical protein